MADPLSEAMKLLETDDDPLMEFSIDDDDDGFGLPPANPFKSPVMTDAGGEGGVGGGGRGSEAAPSPVALGDDPLRHQVPVGQGANLAPPPAATATPPSSSTQPLFSGGPSAAAALPSGNKALIGAEHLGEGASGASLGPVTVAHPQPLSAAASAAAVKSRATAWSSSLGSFAAMAASAASDAVSDAAERAGAAVGQLDQRVTGLTSAPSPSSAAAGGGIGIGLGPASLVPSAPGAAGTMAGIGVGLGPAAAVSPPPAHEMDNARKSTLLTSALSSTSLGYGHTRGGATGPAGSGGSPDDGGLIPGERVIMFLSHITQVRDSAGPNTGVGTAYDALYGHQQLQPREGGGGIEPGAGPNVVWCCAVTFYRVILFSYRESDFAEAEVDMGEAGSSTAAGPTPSNGAAEGTLEDLFLTASVSREYQEAQNVPTDDWPGTAKCPKRHHVLQMPLASIERVERATVPYSAPGGGGSQGLNGAAASLSLIMYGKENGRYMRFTATNYGVAIRAAEALSTYAFPGRRNLGYLFAFESRRTEVMASIKNTEPALANAEAATANGTQQSQPQQQQTVTARATPRRYEPLVEFERMGILRPRDDGSPSPWATMLSCNSFYNLCPSYPSVLVGPSFIRDDNPDGQRLIRQVAGFRSEARMPTLTWGSSIDGASIWRASQPRVGLQGNRSTADEQYLSAIAGCASNAALPPGEAQRILKLPSRQFLRMMIGGTNDDDLLAPFPIGGVRPRYNLKIMDLRPKSSGIANRTQGYGYENCTYYPGCDISFYGIGNIHAVRDAYQKVSSLCLSFSTNDVEWNKLVEDTKWLGMVRLILSASWQTAFHVRFNRIPVLLHCSHGWDRTSQVAALAQIMLEPYYRTKVGFSTLVEKDFLAYGHPFHTRCGHGEGRGDKGPGASGVQASSGGDEGQISPVFIQFVDCVFQLIHQYPEYFEFNEEYLLVLCQHVYSCRFGTLLCDTERERELIAGIRQRTHCLWEYLDSRPDLTNLTYCRDTAGDNRVQESGALFMPLPTLLRNTTLWVKLFCKYGPKPTTRCVIAVGSEGEKWKNVAEEKQREINELKMKIKALELS